MMDLVGFKISKIEKYIENMDFWSSGVRALPVAAGTNEGGHYFRYFFPLLVTLPAFTP